MKLFNRGGAVLTASILLHACVSEQVSPSIDCQDSTIEIQVEQVTNASCGNSDGAFVVSGQGGVPPYLFELNQSSNETGAFNSIAAGLYSVSVTDASGCFSVVDVAVQNEEGVSIDEIAIEDAGCGVDEGEIVLTVSGGVTPYLFSLDGGPSQSEGSFLGLGKGVYTVLVADAAGCEVEQDVAITSGVSYQNQVSTIIETNCAISGCHSGRVSPDLTTFSLIQSNASRIKARTQNRSMPLGRTLSQEEIDLIACWVDDGALNN